MDRLFRVGHRLGVYSSSLSCVRSFGTNIRLFEVMYLIRLSLLKHI